VQGTRADGFLAAGEQVLWRGAPDPGRLFRRRVFSMAQGTVGQLVGLFIFLVAAGAIAQFGPQVLWLVGPVIGFFAISFLVQVFQASRAARGVSYLLTDRRLRIVGRGGPTDLRLGNLADLTLQLHGGGVGTIFFTPPSGAGAQRYLRRLARWIPQIDEQNELMTCIPDAERVMGLLKQAQVDAKAAGPAATAAEPSAGGPSASPIEGPVARQSFMQAASAAPYWFGAAFLVMGLGASGVFVAAVPPYGSWLVGLVPLAFAAIGALFLIARYRAGRVRRRLRAGGVRVTGRVRDVAATGTQINDVEQWVVRYTFEVNGFEHGGQSPLLPWAAAAAYAPGDEVEILYDPEDPAISQISSPAGG